MGLINYNNDALEFNKKIIIQVIQLATIYNAIKKGWRIKKLNYNTYELTKKIDDIGNFNFYEFMNDIVQC
jgi:hypothetical protein